MRDKTGGRYRVRDVWTDQGSSGRNRLAQSDFNPERSAESDAALDGMMGMD